MNAFPKFITLGSHCYITKLMSEAGFNEPGPVDYILDLGPHGETLLDLFTGSFHCNLINKNIDFYGWYNEYDEKDPTMGPFFNRHAKIRYASYFHEDLGDEKTWKSHVELSKKFLDSIHNESCFYVFLYPLKLQEDHIDLAAGLLDKIRVKRERVLIVNPTYKAKSLFPITLDLPEIRDIYADNALSRKYRKELTEFIERTY